MSRGYVGLCFKGYHIILTIAQIVRVWTMDYEYDINPVSLTVKPPPLIGDDISPTCWNFTYGNWQKMEFYSPHYPDKYPTNADCFQYFEAPPGFTIQLDFRDKFKIETSNDCKFDYLEVRDGPFGYSPTIGRFCGHNYPPLVETKTRYVWLRFKTDDILQDEGFRAVYLFLKPDENVQPRKVCRIYIDSSRPDGTIASTDFPDGEQEEPVDCTWEIRAPTGKQIRLNPLTLSLPSPGQCGDNYVALYQTSTISKDLFGRHCSNSMAEMKSKSNRIYVRIYGKLPGYRPNIKLLYTIFGEGECSESEFFCDEMCISSSLICNGFKNCPGGADEKNCAKPNAKATKASEALPLHVIILGAVGGVVVIGIALGLCITWRYKRKEKRKREAQKHAQRPGLEMTVVDSPNISLSSSRGQGSTYMSLPRKKGSRHGSISRNDQRRNSLGNTIQSSLDSDYGDQFSDPVGYKRYMSLEPYYDDQASPPPSLQGPVLTTIVERHPVPPHISIDPSMGWSGYDWKPKSEPSTPPTLSENIAKLAHYGIPNTFLVNPELRYSPDSRFEAILDPKFTQSPNIKYKHEPHFDIGPETKIMEESKYKRPVRFKDMEPDITREIEIS